jgi:tRNA1(Val) A37 N6-methylase TrmN6
MMVAWQYPEARCLGIEARSEAVALARRSIKFNVGDAESRVTVINQDFRELVSSGESTISNRKRKIGSGIDCKDETTFSLPENTLFDLVTGTPPYFQIDFEMTKPTEVLQDDVVCSVPMTVEKAVIRQGGMPTCKESAPARCEFRGGIEAYCCAAAATLAEDGTFVVCENYSNHKRALAAARNASLCVVSIQRVIGKEGKPPLFCVYTMIHDKSSTTLPVQSSFRGIDNSLNDNVDAYHYETDLVVRDKAGAWTAQYAQLLEDMSYPVVR